MDFWIYSSLDEEATRLKPIQGLMPDPTDLPKDVNSI